MSNKNSASRKKSAQSTPSLGDQVRKGAAWSYASQIYLTISSFVIGVVLARIIGPEQFGVFIAVTAFTSILLLLAQFGLPQAIIQARDLQEAGVNSAFWFVTAIGIAAAAFLFLIARPLGTFYDSEEFVHVMQMMSGVMLLTPYTCVGLAVLRRTMRFDDVARIHLVAFTANMIASVVAAVVHAGVYSLVVGAVVQMVSVGFGLYYFWRWVPGLPTLRGIGPLISFASFNTVVNSLELAINRVDNMLVGALLGTSALGLYNRAFSLARLPADQFADSLGPLVLGALSRVQDDVEWSRNLYFKAVSAISIVTMPFLALLLVVGPEAIKLLYGPEWIGAGPPLRAMIFGAVFVTIWSTLRRFALAQNLVTELVRVNAIVLICTVVVVLVSAQWGLAAIAVGITFREILWTLLTVRILGRSRVSILYREVLFAITPSLLASLATIGAVVPVFVALRGASGGAGFLALALTGIIGLLVYGGVLFGLMLIWRSHSPLASTFELILGVGESLRTVIARQM